MEIDIYDSGSKTCNQGEKMNLKALINKLLSDFMQYETRENEKSLVSEMGTFDREMKVICWRVWYG